MSTIRALCFADAHLWSAGARTLIWPPDGDSVEVPAPAAAFAVHRGAVWVLAADQLVPYTPSGAEAGPAISLPFVGLAMAVSGDRLAVGGDGVALVLTWDDGWQAEADLALPGAPHDIDVTSDGARLVAVIGDTLALVELPGGVTTAACRKRGKQLSARFNTSGDVIVASSKEADLRLLPWGKQRMKRLLDTGEACAPPMAMTPDRRELITHRDGELQVIDLEEPRRQYTLRHYQDASTAAAVGAHGFALGFADGTVVRFARHNGAATPLVDPADLPERCLSRHRVSPRAIGRAPDRLHLLSHNALLVEVTPDRLAPVWKGDLPLAPHLPEYFHLHGQLLALPGDGAARWWLLEGDDGPLRLEPRADDHNLLRAFRADGEELWSMALDCGRLAEADGGAYCGLGLGGAVTWVRPSGEGPPVVTPLPVNTAGERRVSPRFQPLPIGGGAFILNWVPRHQTDRCFYLWWPGGAGSLSIGGSVYWWAGLFGQQFGQITTRAVTIWEGETARQGPARRWETEEHPRSRGWVGRRHFYEVWRSETLRVYDAQGRRLVELKGHDDWIVGLITDADEQRAVTWDRQGRVCWWDLSELPAGQGDARVVPRGRFDWDWPAEVQARREAALPSDPAVGAQQQRIFELRDDAAALRRYAWGLPDEVDASVDEALTAALGAWRPVIEVKGDKVNGWLKRSHDVRATERASAAWAFGFAGWEGLAGIERLIDLLVDPDDNVAARAAQSLSSMGPHALPAAGALVAAFPQLSAYGQEQATRALKNLAGPAAKAIATLLGAKKAALRKVGATILCEAGSAGAPAVPTLIAGLGDRRSKAVRQKCCVALGAIGDPAALPALEAALGDKDELVRGAAMRAIVRIGGPGAAPIVRDAARSTDRTVRGAALSGLDPATLPEGVALAVEALSADRSYLRGAAVRALRRYGDPDVLEALAPLRVDPEHDREDDLALLLFELGDREAGLERLLGKLASGQPRQVMPAVRALGGLGRDAASAAPALRALLPEADKWEVGAVAQALGAVGDRASLPAILALLDSEHHWVRKEAVEALRALGGEQARAALERVAADDEPHVALDAMTALHHLGGDLDVYVDRLAAVVRACEVGPSGNAAKALAALGPPALAAEAALRHALRHTHEWVWLPAEAALTALGCDPWVDRPA